ncbi:uncharacterized protein LOC101856290 [Aplysia californica]|uniref:Uncharacterized protein LOC101856290 n=1 Tax=Aplysia californica TaxID=6500 RepID=A0ABM1W053_APLCA|nr:uncharacterized protein LOC101856290 [Aplysia californica]
MSGWASLSGYLFLKPGGGGLSILKARKRLWCILEESQGKLLYYKSEEDARSKPPLGYVELRGAAITLDMDNHNQFVIIVDSKEILLTAENHESMMIWMMALQARRDQFALGEKSRTSSTSTDNDLDPDPSQLDVGGPRERSSSDLTVVRDNYTGQLTVDRFRHRPLEATKSLQGQQLASLALLGRSPEWRRNQLKKMGDTIDNGHPSLKNSPMNFLQPQTRQMSLSMEMAEIVQRTQPPASSTAARAAATNAGAAILNWSSSNSNSSNSNSMDTGEELYTTDNGHRIVVRSASARGSPDLRKGKG